MKVAVDTALRGVLGLVIVAGMLGALWLAHAASARVVPGGHPQPAGASQPPQPAGEPRQGEGRLVPASNVRNAGGAPSLSSARIGQAHVVRTSIAPPALPSTTRAAPAMAAQATSADDRM